MKKNQNLTINRERREERRENFTDFSTFLRFNFRFGKLSSVKFFFADGSPASNRGQVISISRTNASHYILRERSPAMRRETDEF